MRRVVCDVGVVISGLLSADGPPGRLLDRWRDGVFDLIVSPLWLAELARVLERPKIARYLSPGDAEELLAAIRLQAELVDPRAQPGLTANRVETTSSRSLRPRAPMSLSVVMHT